MRGGARPARNVSRRGGSSSTARASAKWATWSSATGATSPRTAWCSPSLPSSSSPGRSSPARISSPGGWSRRRPVPRSSRRPAARCWTPSGRSTPSRGRTRPRSRKRFARPCAGISSGWTAGRSFSPSSSRCSRPGPGGGVMAARKPTAAVPAGRHLLREAEALTGGAVAIFLAFSLLSYAPDLPRQNLGGPVGYLLADTALRALGIASYLFPLYLGFVALALFRRNGDDLGGMRLGGAVLLVCGVAALAGLLGGGRASARGGGWVGGFLGTALRELMGGPGAYLMLGVVLITSLVLATGISAFEVTERCVRWGFARVRAGVRWGAGQVRRRPTVEEPEPAMVRAADSRARVPIPLDDPVD